MSQFIIFLIFIYLIQKLLKTLQEQQKQQQEERPDEEIKDYFQDLGFPLSKKVPLKTSLELTSKPVNKIQKSEVQFIIPAPEKIKAQPKEEEFKKWPPDLSRDKLEEGIVLSVILGTPKAYQFCRGGGIGIRAGLKNQ